MKSYLVALRYGFLVWLIPFIVSVLIYPLKESQAPLFESIMPVIITASVVVFSMLFLRKPESRSLKAWIIVGIMWFLLCFLLDLTMFIWGPMKMPFTAYIKDIGLTYLIIPIISYGFGRIIQEFQSK